MLHSNADVESQTPMLDQTAMQVENVVLTWVFFKSSECQKVNLLASDNTHKNLLTFLEKNLSTSRKDTAGCT